MTDVKSSPFKSSSRRSEFNDSHLPFWEGACRVDTVQRDAHLSRPGSQGMRDELGSVVHPDVNGYSMVGNDPIEGCDDTSGINGGGGEAL